MYVFYGTMYMDSVKRNPKIDFMISALLAMFWLAGAAAWANGLTGLKWSTDTSNWLHKMSICRLTSHTPPTYGYVQIRDCVGSAGQFAGANSAVLLGFLNFFLWAANLWYLYKETAWFSGNMNNMEQRMEAGVVASNVEQREKEEEDDLEDIED